MYVLITGFLILGLFFCSFLDYILCGSIDLTTAQLTVAISSTNTTAVVDSTAGFSSADYIVINNEDIAYNGKTDTSFLHLQRGYNSTTPDSHIVGDTAYAKDSAVVNNALGFNIVTMGSSVGSLGVLSVGIKFITKTIPTILTWNYYFLKTGYFVYLRLLFILLTAVMGFLIALQLISALGGLLQRAWI